MLAAAIVVVTMVTITFVRSGHIVASRRSWITNMRCSTVDKFCKEIQAQLRFA